MASGSKGLGLGPLGAQGFRALRVLGLRAWGAKPSGLVGFRRCGSKVSRV